MKKTIVSICALFVLLFTSLPGNCQTFSDNFNRADNTTVGNGWTELETVAPGSAQILTNRLQLGSTTAGREFVYRDVSSIYTTNGITTNTGLIVWAFNFRQTRTTPSGFDANNYGMAFILGSTSNTVTAGNGYAVVLGGASPNALRLTSFAAGPNLNSHFTDIISGGSFSTTYISVRVVYNPVTDEWSLYAEGNATSFPRSNPFGTAAQIGITTVNTAFTSGNDLKYMGAFWNHGTGASETAVFDDISVATGVSLTANLGDHVTDANANGQANPGETIQYRDTIKNVRGIDADNVILTNTAPANTTFNSGTVKTSALARDDNYTTSVNFAITSAANLNVLTNDYGLPSISVLSYGTTASGGSTTLAGAVGATNGGGTITINAAGLITNYTPASNFSGIDQFRYIARAGTGLPDNDAIVSITVPDINFTTTLVDPSCNNGTNGSITINATGGVGTLTYSKNGSGGPYQASNVFSGLAAGLYNLAVKDANGYFKTGTATLNNPAAIVVTGNNVPTLTYTVAMTPITFSKTGGTGTPANPWSATGLPAGLSINSATGDLSGTPTVTGTFNAVIIYTDANNCTGSLNKTINVAPKLTGDAYNVVGNTQLVANNHSTPTTPFTSSATNIITNDQSNATITTVAGTFATANGGSITIGNDGKFTYTPPAGFTGPTDSYPYTATSNGVNAIATITFNISGMVWYVNNTNAGTETGTSDKPFNTVNEAASASSANQIIYVHTGSGNTPGAAVLKSGQTLRGAGSALSVGALSIAAGTKPTLSGTVTLANTVTVDGFDMNTGSANALASTSATGVVVSIGNINTNGAAFPVSLVNTTGSVTIAGGTQTNATTSAFYISGGTVSLTYSGSITHNANSSMVEVGGSHNTGTVTFNTGTLTATGTGTALFFSDANGTYNFNGTTTMSSAAGIYIANTSSTTGGTFSFGTGTTITNPTGTAFKVFNGRANVTYSGNITKNNAGTMVEIGGGHNTGTVTFQTGTLSATTASAGNGLQFDNADGTYNFNGTTTLNGGDAAIDISNGSDGTFSFGSGTSITNPLTNAITISGGAGNITYSGTFSKTNNAAAGIYISSRTGGIVSINGTGTKTLSSTTADAILLSSNTGATINFSGNNLSLTTTSGIGFNAIGGGTINVTGTGNTITTTTGTAVNIVTPTNIGGSGVTFQSITVNNGASNSAVNAIVLNGTTGPFLVTGDGSQTAGLYDRDGTGGTINRTTGHSVLLTNAQNVTLRKMNITNTAGGGACPGNCNSNAVNSVGGSNIILSAVTLQNLGGNGWLATNLTGGTNAVDNNSRIDTWQTATTCGVSVANTTTNFNGTFTIDHCVFTTSATGADGFLFDTDVAGTGTVNVTNSEFTLIDQDAVQINNDGSGILTAIVQKNNFHDADATGGDGNNTLICALAGSGQLNFTIGGPLVADGNTFTNLSRLSADSGVLQVLAAGGTASTGAKLNGTIQNNTLTNPGFISQRRGIMAAAEASSGNHGGHSILIANNSVQNFFLQGIYVSMKTINAVSVSDNLNNNITIRNNQVGNISPVGQSGGDAGSAIEFETNNATTVAGSDISANVLIQGNTAVSNNSSAIGDALEINSLGANVAGSTSTVNVTVWGNNLTQNNPTGQVFRARTVVNATSSMCLDLNADNIVGNRNTVTGGASFGFRVSQDAGTGTYSIDGMGAGAQTAAAVQAFLAARNNGNVTTSGSFTGAPGGCANSTARMIEIKK
jgi:hypothetical protein